MDDTKRIPDMVAAQVRLHVAETEIRLETAKAANAGRPVTTSESRRLRVQRDRLAAELDAWRYLVAIAERPMHRDTDTGFPCSPCGICSECGYLG